MFVLFVYIFNLHSSNVNIHHHDICILQKISQKKTKIISTKAQKQEMKKQIRLLFTLGIMVGTFSLGLLPSVTLVTLQIVPRYSSLKSLLIVLTSSIVLVTSNSLWNFFIYNARNKAFRLTSKRLYKKLLCCLKYIKFSNQVQNLSIESLVHVDMY